MHRLFSSAGLLNWPTKTAMEKQAFNSRELLQDTVIETVVGKANGESK